MIILRFIGASIRFTYVSFRGNREPFSNFLENNKKAENERLNAKLGLGLIATLILIFSVFKLIIN